MKRTPALVLLTFILLSSSQAILSAQTNHNFAKWEQEIKAYEASDRTNSPPKHAILFTGASTIRRWATLAQDFPNQQVINRGVGGSEVVDITHFADRIVFPYEPKLIFLRSGGNDIHDGKSPEQVFADFKDFVVLVRAKLPDTDIVFISQNPSIARWDQRDKEHAFNAMVQEYSKQSPHLKYCEISDIVLDKDGKARPDLFVADKLHFNAAGYKLLAERVRAFLPKAP
jgi:lysophospholipase L1-like esterase